MNKKLTHNIPKAALTLLVMLTMSFTASATNFITDVMVIGNNNETQFYNLQESYVAQGWTPINKDLNAGCGTGSDYIHLLYKTNSSSGNSASAITDFYIKTGNNPPASLTHQNRTYYLVPYDGSDNFINSKGDLNRGAGGDYIHLYYTKELLTNLNGVTDITFNDTQSGAVGCNGGTTGYDLNEGCGSGTDYIYMHLTTTTGANVVTLSSGSANVPLQNGHTLTGTGGASTQVTIADGATVTLNGVNITAIPDSSPTRWAAISCLGNVVIVLGGGTTNTVKGGYNNPGIHVPQNKTLTIQGSGTLNTTGGNGGAGIGSGWKSSCGNITISGGTVTANGGEFAAGIGSGYFQSSCGNITISGGTVTAIGNFSAGIGSGYDHSSCGSITISGGTVTANGGSYGAGIGSSENNSSCGNITISGGTVTANGGSFAAGIGSGNGHNSSCGDITISYSVTRVTAQGDFYDISIGAVGNNSTCGTIHIGSVETGSITQNPFTTYPYTVSFNTNGGTGSMANQSFMYNVAQNLITNSFTNGIYHFYGWATSSNGETVYEDGQSVSNLTQTSGVTVTLYAKWSNVKKLTTQSGEVLLYDGNILTGTGGKNTRIKIVDGATVTLRGVNITAIPNTGITSLWAAISCLGDAVIILEEGTTSNLKGGLGSPGIHVPQNMTLTIQGSGTLNSTGISGAGIGSSSDSGTCGNIIISSGTINAYGSGNSAGIGTGANYSSCGNITISGGTVTAYGSGGAGIGCGYAHTSCGNITISGGTVTAYGSDNSAGIGSSNNHCNCGNITITRGVTMVTATKGDGCDNAIGAGINFSTCGIVTVDEVQTGFITQSPFTTYPYTVSFNANGGTGSMANMNFMYSIAQNLTPNSFTLSGAEFEGWATSTNGTKAYNNGQSVNNLTQTSGATVTLYAKWNIDPAHLSVSGNEYTIHTATGWNTFCELLANNSADFFTGTIVKLDADITVSRMAGSSDHSFSGTFNGQGHTLTVNYNTSEPVTAPFRFVTGATITNLVTAGTITTSAKFASGMIGKTNGDGTVNITNCMSSDTINSNVNGDGTHGGFVGSVTYGTMNITGCTFNGKMRGTSTTKCGGFVGWTESSNNATATITDCLFAPTTLEISDGNTFSRARNMNSVTITNSYYTTSLGVLQGKQAVTHAAVTATGNAINTYSVSGISTYSNGMQYNTTFYYDPERNFLRDIHYYQGNNGWYLIASPMPGNTLVSNVSNLITSNSAYDLYYFDQTGGDNGAEWKNYKAHYNDATNPFNALANGKGYLYANSATVSLVFSGVPYTGNGQITLSKDNNARLGQWNLIGNPFNTNATLGTKPFYIMNDGGTEIIAADNNHSVIAPMQGVFVEANNDGEIVTFTSSAKGTDNEASIVLNLAQNGSTPIDRVIVRLGKGEALSKLQIRDGNTKVYIPQDGKDYAVVNVGTDVARNVSTNEIPINFKAAENGTYTISVNTDKVEMDYLHLIDNLTGADIDLLATSFYAFNAKTTDYASRFKLVFMPKEDGTSTSSATFGYYADGRLVISSIKGVQTLQVIDMLGHVVLSENVTGSYDKQLNLAPGVYMVRLNERTQKIVMK